MHKRTVEFAKEFCRKNRKNQTKSESLLWNVVRNRQLHNKKFDRQFPIFFCDVSGKESFYIADFYCHEYKLIIELDGRSHIYQVEYDKLRNDTLEGMGYKVIRFTNEMIEQDLQTVLGVLERHLY